MLCIMRSLDLCLQHSAGELSGFLLLLSPIPAPWIRGGIVPCLYLTLFLSHTEPTHLCIFHRCCLETSLSTGNLVAKWIQVMTTELLIQDREQTGSET